MRSSYLDASLTSDRASATRDGLTVPAGALRDNEARPAHAQLPQCAISPTTRERVAAGGASSFT